MNHVTRLLLAGFLLLAFELVARDEIVKQVSQLEQAVVGKDVSLLDGCIAPDFSISAATMPGAINYLQPILRQGAEVDSIRVASIGIHYREKDREKRLGLVFYLKGQAPIRTFAGLNEANQFRYIDYFDQLYGMSRDRTANLRAVIPFEWENNAIILSLRLNESERPFRFLFDTGADGMAITKHLADSLGLQVSREQSASIVGENRTIRISSGNVVYLDTLSIPNQNIAIFEDMGTHDGIIGLNLAKQFIVKVDFDRLQLSLYSLGDYSYEPGGIRIPVKVPSGIMKTLCTLNLLGNKALTEEYIFDTGAGFHVVAFSPFVRKNRLLLSGFKYESSSSMLSMGHATLIYHGKAVDFKVGDVLHRKDMPIALQASSGGGNWDPEAAGSIGIQLISQYNFTINLVEKEIYMQPRDR